MPVSPSAAVTQPPSTSYDREGARRRRSIRRVAARPAALAIGLALLFPAAAITPDLVQAGSCTGWGSTTTPPNSIRVLRTATGRVEQVDFKRYVQTVMGKEWGNYLPMAMLEAGAQAVKQYAWYFTLEGRHRGGYSNGQCYDVKDSTADQLYKPEQVTIYDKQRSAVNAIWGLSLRENGRFILTQYRTGLSGVACAADADSVKLYARSATKCANAGWSSQRILNAYYGPGLDFVWANTSGAGSTTSSGTFSGTVSTPRSPFKTGNGVSKAPLLIRWQPTSGATAIASYQVQRLVSGSWRTVSTQSASDRDFAVNVNWGSSQRFRVRALNSSGAAGPWSTGPTISPLIFDDRRAAISWSGGWKRTSDAGAYGDTTTTSANAGASASFTFTGRSVAVIGTLGPGRGKARIYINGNHVATVDLYRSTKSAGRVIYSRAWGASSTRTIKVVVVGTADRPRVDIDGFAFVR